MVKKIISFMKPVLSMVFGVVTLFVALTLALLVILTLFNITTPNAKILLLKCIAIIFLVILCYLCFMHLRYVYKRIKLYYKIKNICNSNNYKIYKTSKFCFLKGLSLDNKCDMYVETPSDIYAIKFFGIISKQKSIVFTGDNEFCFRRMQLRRSANSKPMYFPTIDFSANQFGLPGIKTLHNIMIFNPAPHKIVSGDGDPFGRNKEYDECDKFSNFYIMGGSYFVNHLFSKDFDFESADKRFLDRT